MDELRLSLLALFVALVAGIYIRETLRRKRDDLSAPADAAVAGSRIVGATRVSADPEAGVNPQQKRPEGPDHGGVDRDRLAGDDHFLGDEWLGEDRWNSGGARGDVPLGDIDLLAAEDGSGLGPDAGSGASGSYAQAQLDLYFSPPEESIAADPSGGPGPNPVTSANGEAPGPDDPGRAELIVVFHVMHREQQIFEGASVRAALARAGLEFGDMGIFHHRGVGAAPSGLPVFSVAKAVEPGTFDESDDSSFETPGLTLFMRLPGPQDGAVVLELMFAAAQSLARALGAQVLDDKREALSAGGLNHLRESVYEFCRRDRAVTS